MEKQSCSAHGSQKGERKLVGGRGRDREREIKQKGASGLLLPYPFCLCWWSNPRSWSCVLGKLFTGKPIPTPESVLLRENAQTERKSPMKIRAQSLWRRGMEERRERVGVTVNFLHPVKHFWIGFPFQGVSWGNGIKLQPCLLACP